MPFGSNNTRLQGDVFISKARLPHYSSLEITEFEILEPGFENAQVQVAVNEKIFVPFTLNGGRFSGLRTCPGSKNHIPKRKFNFSITVTSGDRMKTVFRGKWKMTLFYHR